MVDFNSSSRVWMIADFCSLYEKSYLQFIRFFSLNDTSFNNSRMRCTSNQTNEQSDQQEPSLIYSAVTNSESSVSHISIEVEKPYPPRSRWAWSFLIFYRFYSKLHIKQRPCRLLFSLVALVCFINGLTTYRASTPCPQKQFPEMVWLKDIKK